MPLREAGVTLLAWGASKRKEKGVERLDRSMTAIGVWLVLWGAGCGDSAPSGPTNPPSPSTTTTTTSAPPATTTSTTTTTTSVPVSQTVRQATFQSANGYTTEGSARIIANGGSYSLELGSDFRSSQSPALDVRLCNDPNCRGANLDLGSLRSFSGRQTYAMPNDGSAYSQVMIYCRAVQLAFGFGSLR